MRKNSTGHDLHIAWAMTFMRAFCNTCCDFHMEKTGSGEHIGISPLTNKRVKPRKDSAVCHHLLNCNYSPTFEDFSVLHRVNKKYLLELKEGFL